jgi:hypothetical protein
MNSTGRCIADQGGFAPAMQYLLNLQTAGALLQTDYVTAESKFLNGEVGMLINGPWTLANYKATLGANLGVVILPNGPSGLARSMNGIEGFYVNPNTANPANTVALALYMTNQASSQIFTDTGGHIPVRSDVTSIDPLINTFSLASAQGFPRPQNQELGNYWSPFTDMITAVLTGSSAPQAGVQKACFQMNELNGFPVSVSLNSIAAQDGYLLESSETSAVGGTMNASIATIRLGDDVVKKQYRSILSFNTSSLPDTAVITKVTLKVKQQGIVGGGNPVTMFQGFMLDMRKGTFGTSALQVTDWQANANKTYGPFTPALTGGWYTFNLTSAKAYINKLATGSGLTQIRLRFQLDDNNNAIANYLSLYSGNGGATSRPQLIIEYYVP